MAIALAVRAPSGGTERFKFIAGSKLAALPGAAAIGFAFAWSDFIVSMLGRVDARTRHRRP